MLLSLDSKFIGTQWHLSLLANEEGTKRISQAIENAFYVHRVSNTLGITNPFLVSGDGLVLAQDTSTYPPKMLLEVSTVIGGVAKSLQICQSNSSTLAGKTQLLFRPGLIVDASCAYNSKELISVKPSTRPFAANAILKHYDTLQLQEKAHPFIHTPLHDMESVFWVVFYILLSVGDQEDDEKCRIQRKIISIIFNAMGYLSMVTFRRSFVRGRGMVRKNYVALFDEDEHQCNFLDKVLRLRGILTEYENRIERASTEDGRVIDVGAGAGIHAEFEAVWAECEAHLADQDVPLCRPLVSMTELYH